MLKKVIAIMLFNPKRCGGRGDPPTAQEIGGYHFSRKEPNVLKIPDYIRNDVGPRVKESF